MAVSVNHLTFPSRSEALVAMVLERFKLSEACSETYFSRARSWYDMYRSWYRDPELPQYRNNVFIPMIFSTVWSDTAKKAQALFGNDPMIAFIGSGQEDFPYARQQEQLINAQLRDADTFLKGIDLLLSGSLYGSAPAMTGWRYDAEMLPERSMAATPITQQLVERVRMKETILFDGPDWEPLDILDFYPEPDVARLPDMRWKIRRYYLDIDDIRGLVKAKLFDPGVVQELEMVPMQNDLYEMWKRRNSYQRNNLIKPDRFSKPVELIEMWGKVPDDLARDGVTKRVITIANRKVLCRDRANPYHHGRDPFLHYCPVVDPHNFRGPSKVEMSAHLNAIANRLMSGRLDVLDMTVDPPHLYDRMLGVDPENLYTRPGRWIATDGPPAGAIQPMVPDLRGFQLSHQEVEFAWRWMQNASGIHEDAVMGAGGPDRETAYGFAGRQAAVNTRLLLETAVCEQQFLEPLGNVFLKLDRQFLSLPLKRKILGSNAITDPITGMPVLEPLELDGYALSQEYDARARGSSQVLPKEARRQSFLAMLDAVARTPGAQIINWLNFFRQMFPVFDLTNVDELLLTPPMQQLAQILANQPAGGAIPGQMGPVPGGEGMVPGEEVGATEPGGAPQDSESSFG